MDKHATKTDENNNSIKKYAFTTLVMKGDRYAKGAIALAHSIALNCKEDRAKFDIVCMITDDVPKEAVHAMEQVFDRCITVPYISQKTLPMKGAKQMQMYGHWFEQAFTKWNCLAWEDSYSKVLFLDSDTIVVKNIVHLFSLQAPAGTFSRRNAEPFCKGGLENIFHQYKHGDEISLEHMSQALKNGHFIIIGTTVLLQPSKKDFEAYLQLLRKEEVYRSNETPSISCADEVSITDLYHQLKTPWTYISQIYNWIPWNGAGDWLLGTGYTENDVGVYHFYGLEKPWEVEKNKYEDSKIFYNVVDDLLEKNSIVNHYWTTTQSTKAASTISSSSSKPSQQQQQQSPKSNNRFERISNEPSKNNNNNTNSRHRPYNNARKQITAKDLDDELDQFVRRK